MRRVMKRGARIALGFTVHSGQPKDGLTDLLAAAGFVNPELTETASGFCILAKKP